MPRTHSSKVVILGSGPAGYTAAIYAARASLSPMLVRGMQPGGQLSITTEVENFPGFATAVQGPWLMDQMAAQAAHVGTTLVEDMIVSVDLSKRPFVLSGDSGDTYLAETLIVCTGAQARWLGLESETRLRGFGVSACATCDGFFFRGKTVAVAQAATPPPRKPSTSPTTPARSTSSIAETRCAPTARTSRACSRTRRSRWSGTA